MAEQPDGEQETAGYAQVPDERLGQGYAEPYYETHYMDDEFGEEQYDETYGYGYEASQDGYDY